MDTFQTRIDELDEMVGHGDLTGRVVVDQVYAKYQHERLDLKHPGGGKAMYLRDPLFVKAPGILRHIATELLVRGPENGMQHGVESIADGVRDQAPIEFGDLKNSAHPSVEDHGVLIYNRPPLHDRLSKEALREKSRLRSLGFGRIG